MNIVKEDLKDLTSLLKVTVDEADYKGSVEKELHNYKKRANIPGFRPGMVPMGIINKMYRKGVVAEQTYKIASEACFNYLKDNQIDYIGDILPSDKQTSFDFENNTSHEFIFEFAAAPKVDINLSNADKVTKHVIKIDNKMRESYRTNFLRRFGRLVDVDVVEKEEALSVTLDSEAMQVEDAYVGLVSMDDNERKPFIGKKVGDTMKVDITKLYKTPSQRASILSVKESELETIDPNFNLTITKIRKFAEPEMNDEFFKMAFPDGAITDEKALAKYIDEQISAELSVESGYMLKADIRDLLLKKADLPMPSEFLKRWLFTINEGKFSMEDIEKDFSSFEDMMRWNIIRGHYAQLLELKIEPEDAMAEAKAMAKAQFAQYGMSSVADDMLENYAKSILENKEEARRIYEKIMDSKVIDGVAETLKIAEKSVSVDEYGKLVEARGNKK